jgi:hypothetical protein
MSNVAKNIPKNTTSKLTEITQKITKTPISTFFISKALINTIIRLVPLSLYSGAIISGLVFDDFRAKLLFFGFVINEMISFGYRLILRGVSNPQCATLTNTGTDFFVLPSPITQTVGFFVGFMLMHMYSNNTFYPATFFVYMILIVLTVFSRVNIGCKSILEALYCLLLGLILGVGYYSIVKPYYKEKLFSTDEGNSDGVLNDFFKLD